MSLFDLSSVISDLNTGTYTVTRTAPNTYDSNGRLVAGSTSSIFVVASVQPLFGRDLQQLPEGQHTSDMKAVYCATELKTQGSAQAADLIAIGGETYQVQKVENWSDSGNYFKALVAKVEK